MMIAAIVATLDHRRATELPAPDHQRVVQQAALLEVFDERRRSLIGVATILFEVGHEAAVLVPRLVENLDEAHAFFDEPAREQHALANVPLPGSAPYISSVAFDSLEMSINSGAVSCMRCASSNELMRVAISGSPDHVKVFLVKPLDCVERVALDLFIHALWIRKIEDRVAGHCGTRRLDELMAGSPHPSWMNRRSAPCCRC